MTTSTIILPGLPPGITSRRLQVLDLDIHVLEASPSIEVNSDLKLPLLVLLHGFPELAYSWRKVMLPLAKSGYKVVAPDLRGYGQTIQRSRSSMQKISYEEDLAPYRMLNIVTDIIALVYALGYNTVEAVVGHDFGSPIAAHCALIRPDIFKSLIMMSAPYSGTPTLGSIVATADDVTGGKTRVQMLDDALRTLDPPKKHYMIYFSSPEANDDLTNPPQGFAEFLRTYYHTKSADWKKNDVRPLTGPIPASLTVLPSYYIMPLSQPLPDSLKSEAPSAEEVKNNTWLPDEELDVYISQYAETGFQGGLNYYRCNLGSPQYSQDLNAFMGKKIEVPAAFIAGAQDWGVFQFPGAADAMRQNACRQFRDEDFILIDGAGHWVQQEKPDAVVNHILAFIKRSNHTA